MSNLAITGLPVSEIELALQQRPDPVLFAEKYFPAIIDLIKYTKDPQEASRVRMIAKLADVYVKDGIKQVVKDRHEAYKITEKGAWAHLLAVRNHGRLWGEAKKKGETQPVGNPEILKQDKKYGKDSNSGNFPNWLSVQDAGFRNYKDATVSERIGDLDIQDLEILREEMRDRERYVTMNNAHWVWKLLNPDEKSVPINPEDYLILKAREDAARDLLEGNTADSLEALLFWITHPMGSNEVLDEMLRQALADVWACEKCGRKDYTRPLPMRCTANTKHWPKLKAGDIPKCGGNFIRVPWNDGEEPIKDLAWYVNELSSLQTEDYYFKICTRLAKELAGIFREEFANIKQGVMFGKSKPDLTDDEMEIMSKAAELAHRIRGCVDEGDYHNYFNRAAINIEYGIENLLIGE